MSSVKYPIYQKEIPSLYDGLLFHYTKFDSFINIIKTMSLRSSPFSKLNDRNEGDINDLSFCMCYSLVAKIKELIRNNCRLICFSKNYKNDEAIFKGTNHPAMWAHYADNLNGVCIVLDENEFKSKNKELFDKHFIQFGDVSYSIINSPSEDEFDYSIDSPHEFIKKHWDKLFLKKHNDWRYEVERRLFILDCENEFNIEGCIRYIVLGKRLVQDESKVKLLFDVLTNPQNSCYHNLTPNSFAAIEKSPIGYHSYDIGSTILDKIRQYKEDYTSYIEWLHKDAGVV